MKKLITIILAGLMVCIPFVTYADESDLESRVAALEERVAALEAQLTGLAPTGVSEAPNQEEVSPAAIDTGIEWEGCTLEYKDFELITDSDGNECVLLYFDYFNGSGETKNYYGSFEVEAFQNGKEMETASAQGNEAYDEKYTDLRSGADPLRVASCFKLTDHSDIIVSLIGFTAFGEDPVEFTLSLE